MTKGKTPMRVELTKDRSYRAITSETPSLLWVILRKTIKRYDSEHSSSTIPEANQWLRAIKGPMHGEF